MRQFMKPERIRIIAVLAIFNYIFLGSEYLFDNMIRYATDSAGVVRAQNYVLGISVIGFLLFPCINRYFNQKMREIGLYLLPVAGIICIFVIQEHLSYRSMLLSGFLLYILYGMIGNIIGLVCIWVYQYSGLISKGVVRLDSARVMLTWPLFINLTVCTIISRRFYKKTGKVYIGALMNTILFTVIGCANTMTLHCTNWWF